MTPCIVCGTEAPTGRADGYCPECFRKMQAAMNAELVRRGALPIFSASALQLAALEHQAAQTRPPSLVEEISSARSPFQVDRILDDFKLFANVRGDRLRRVLEQLERTAYVRKCQLAGALP